MITMSRRNNRINSNRARAKLRGIRSSINSDCYCITVVRHAKAMLQTMMVFEITFALMQTMTVCDIYLCFISVGANRDSV
jgi:DNA-binding FrmR family transcriptional regulator